jgi:hypothetical protein
VRDESPDESRRSPMERGLVEVLLVTSSVVIEAAKRQPLG